jgi:predicted transposase YbfD/YdcC
VQTLIETLGLTGRVFTIDAMHCQKNIRDRQGDGQ